MPAVRFRPGSQDDLAPSGQKARFAANLEAIRVVKALEAQQRPATVGEQAVLARWSGWGAVPQLFDKDDWAPERAQLQQVLDDREYAAASRTTTNAYYTDAALVKEIWSAVGKLGFTGGEVLEPGSGAGTFIGFAPDGARMTGVELDPLTAAISRGLYPHATIRTESFADTPVQRNSFDLAIGNVPFSKNALYDKTHNRDSKHSMHNHFILKSLDAVKPGGYVAVLTSRAPRPKPRVQTGNPSGPPTSRSKTNWSPAGSSPGRSASSRTHPNSNKRLSCSLLPVPGTSR